MFSKCDSSVAWLYSPGISGSFLDVFVESLAGASPHRAAHDRGPSQQQAGRPERLAAPAVEVELVAVLDDQAVAKSHRGANVVGHRPPGLRERVAGDPPGGAPIPVGLVL